MTYQGHHPKHTALQNHSVGAFYPLALVGISGINTRWAVQDLTTSAWASTPVSILPNDTERKEWARAEEARMWLEGYLRGENLAAWSMHPRRHDGSIVGKPDFGTGNHHPQPEAAPGRWNWYQDPNTGAPLREEPKATAGSPGWKPYPPRGVCERYQVFRKAKAQEAHEAVQRRLVQRISEIEDTSRLAAVVKLLS